MSVQGVIHTHEAVGKVNNFFGKVRTRRAHSLAQNCSQQGPKASPKPPQGPNRRKPRPKPDTRIFYRHVLRSGRWYRNPNITQPTASQVRAYKRIRAQANMMMAGRTKSEPFNPATLRMALNAPARLKSMLTKEACFSVIWDSGATITISNNPKDFVGKIRKPSVWQRLTGIARGLKIEGEGEVLWAMMGTDGRLRLLKLPALYIPSSPQRLLSTTSLLQTYPDEEIKMDSQKAQLSGKKGDPTKAGVVAMVNPTNNLPTTVTYHYNDLESPTKELNNIIATVHKKNINLSESEKELMKWHNRLGHFTHRRIQGLMRSGVLAHTAETRRLHTATAKLRSPPPCAACMFGKQTTKPKPGRKTVIIQDQAGSTRQQFTHSGQCVAVEGSLCLLSPRKAVLLKGNGA